MTITILIIVGAAVLGLVAFLVVDGILWRRKVKQAFGGYRTRSYFPAATPGTSNHTWSNERDPAYWFTKAKIERKIERKSGNHAKITSVVCEIKTDKEEE